MMHALAEIARARTPGLDPAHDFLHVQRVVATARKLALDTGALEAVVAPAALLHELFNHPKDHPESSRSGEVCAEHARAVLVEVAYPSEHVDAICYAIAVHPFSAGKVPETPEARVLQDADRLDALGAVGIARCFSTGARMGTPFYSGDDPFCARREPDDRRYSVDHFFRKLLKLGASMHTPAARLLAEERIAFMRRYLAELERELG